MAEKIIKSISIFGRTEWEQTASFQEFEYVAGAWGGKAIKLNDSTLAFTLHKDAKAVVIWGKHEGDSSLHHYVYMSNGAVWKDGKEVPNYGTTLVTFNSMQVTVKGRYILEELLLLPYHPEQEEIDQWVENPGSFFDPSEPGVQWKEIRYSIAEINQVVEDLDAEPEESRFSSIRQTATSVSTLVEDMHGEDGVVSQVNQLADRYSVKTQKTSGGKTYATGFVSGINEQNESEFAVLADRFRVFGTNTSDGQAVFAVDTVTKKAYFLADLIVNGLVRATALEAEQLKTYMIQAGYAVFDEADILDLTARKIVGGNGAFELTPGKLTINTEQLKLDEAGNAEFGGSLKAATGTFAGDISGASGTFADGRVAIGDIEGKPWGDSALPAGTAGIWGDQAGLYLRGYARLLTAGTGMDEDTIDLSGFPNLNEPEILVAPRELVTYSPAPGTLSHIIVDAVKQPDGTYRLKAKTLTKGTTVSWGGRSSTTHSWTFIRPTDSIDGKKGVYTNFFICRPTWWVGSGGFGMYTAKLYMYVTDEFNANGDPINWKQIRSFSRSSSGSGTLNWDTALPHSGQWALRVSGSGGGAVLVDYATTGLSKSGYRTGDTYLDVNGDQITGTDSANTPSGMSVIYMVFDKG